METLNRKVYKDLAKGSDIPERGLPEKVLQFGEGKFLRAFADWMIHNANIKGLFGGSVVVAAPRSDHLLPAINGQNGLFTLYLRGLQEGKRYEKQQVVTSISRALSPRKQWKELVRLMESPELRFIISNTTEAGIVYRQEPPYKEGFCPESFPAKITALLYYRYRRFGDAPGNGIILLPCELLDQNGDILKDIVLRLAEEWGLPQRFLRWLEDENYFLNTLVDRIVTGVNPDSLLEEWEKLGYRDELVNAAEPYHLWVIAAPEQIRREFPLDKAGLNLLWVDDIKPHRTRKVRILNGAHTAAVAVSLLRGIKTVREAVEDEATGSFIKGALFEEIIPSLQGIAVENSETFALNTLERFRNPFISHLWTDISVNSFSKYRERVLPSLLDYLRLRGILPDRLTFSLAALLALYGGASQGEGGVVFTPRDNAEVMNLFIAARTGVEGLSPPERQRLVKSVLRQESVWGSDLTVIPGLVHKVSSFLEAILDKGAAIALTEIIDN